MLEGDAAAAEVAIGAAAGGDPAFTSSPQESYTAEDKVVISERLRALGYID
jgi:hypothetical protein